MAVPVVLPHKVRSDIAFLGPDLRRPGLALRSTPDPEVAAASAEPPALLERVERELSGEAHRYRAVLLTATATFFMPALLTMFLWSGLYLLPVRIQWFPFERGMYYPGPSVFETIAVILLAIFLVVGYRLTGESWRAMRRLSPDYRRLRDAEPDVAASYASEAVSGRWPRSEALLARARGFEGYRPLLEQARVACPPEEAPCGQAAEEDDALGALRLSVRQMAAFALFAVAATVIGGLVAVLIMDTKEHDRAKTLFAAAGLIVGYLSQLGVLAWLAERRHVTFSSAVGLRRFAKPGMWIAAALGVALGARAVALAWTLGLQALGMKPPLEALDPTRLLPDTDFGRVMLFFIVVLLAPFVEEVVFRGVVLSSLRDRWGDWPAIVASSVLFGLIHASIWAIVPITVFALLLGVMFVRSRSLWVPIIAHIIFNGSALGLYYALRAAGL